MDTNTYDMHVYKQLSHMHTCRVFCFPFAILLFSKYKLHSTAEVQEGDWFKHIHQLLNRTKTVTSELALAWAAHAVT